jgi:glycosyltransferase involved in cell wall biosynthesis
MKIALLHFTAPPVVGGVESVLLHHARLMTESGHEVTIFAGRGQSYDPAIQMQVQPLFNSRNPEVLAVKKELDRGICSSAFTTLRDRIQKILDRELPAFDLVIAHNVASLNQNLPLTAALYSAHTAPGFPRLILWHHDLAWTTPRYKNELHDGYPWQLLRQNWPGVTQVVVSETRRKELSQLMNVPIQQIQVVPNGVELNTFLKLSSHTIELAEKLKLLDADPLFLLPVRITPRKNIELALRILKAFRRSNPDAMLLVTGPEGPHNPANGLYRQELIQLRNELQLQGYAHFLAETTSEFLPDEVIADLYRLADVLLFPSREEGFGIPVIEAGFSGIPVFCADIPVFHELGGADLSYFNPDGDPERIAGEIGKRLNSEMTFRWARRARHGFTWRSINRKYIEPLINRREQI